jgi:hypothetical protein
MSGLFRYRFANIARSTKPESAGKVAETGTPTQSILPDRTSDQRNGPTSNTSPLDYQTPPRQPRYAAGGRQTVSRC